MRPRPKQPSWWSRAYSTPAAGRLEQLDNAGINLKCDEALCPRYAAAKAVVLPSVAHFRGWRQNNRVENSHQPVRQRERGLQRFKSLRHAARFCAVFSTVCNQFRPGRHALSALNYRRVMRRRWREWDVASETTAFAIAA
jgi:DDE domain